MSNQALVVVSPVRYLSIAVLLALPLPAADAVEPLAIPPEAVCAPGPEGSAVVDPVRLISWLVDHAGLSDATLDRDGDGDTLLVEKVAALVERDHCARAAGGCSPGDAAALETLRQGLAAFIQAGGGAAFALRRRGAQDFDERAPRPLSISDLLDPTGRQVRIVCTGPQWRAAPRERAAPVETAEEAPAWEWHVGPEEGLRLGGEIDGLGVSRERLHDVKAAEFSIASDLRRDRQSYSINAVLGYAFEASRAGRARVLGIPFVAYQRSFDGAEDEVDRLGFGFQQAGTLRGARIGVQEAAVTGLYTTDSDFEADIVSLKFRWTPLLPEPAPVPLGFYGTYGPVLVKTGIDGLAEAGRVFEAGDNQDLEDDEGFLRPGGRLLLSLRGAPDTLFERFELSLTNKYLVNVGGDVRHINRFEAALSYLLPRRENYKLSISYVNGRTDDTLERVEFWRTQLGIRF